MGSHPCNLHYLCRTSRSDHRHRDVILKVSIRSKIHLGRAPMPSTLHVYITHDKTRRDEEIHTTRARNQKHGCIYTSRISPLTRVLCSLPQNSRLTQTDADALPFEASARVLQHSIDLREGF